MRESVPRVNLGDHKFEFWDGTPSEQAQGSYTSFFANVTTPMFRLPGVLLLLSLGWMVISQLSVAIYTTDDLGNPPKIDPRHALPCELLTRRKAHAKLARSPTLRARQNHTAIGVHTTFKFHIHVFLFGRTGAAKTLLSDLKSASYARFSRNVHLSIHINCSSKTALSRMATDWTWPFGQKVVDTSCMTSLLGSWMHAWKNPESNEVRIAFEDDQRVSPMYFQWLLKLMDLYWRPDPAMRDPQLIGFSLSAMSVDAKCLVKRELDDNLVYLNAAPALAGAVHFGDKWKEFLEFCNVLEARNTTALFDTGLSCFKPGTRSYSQERLLDFVHCKGYYTLYPVSQGTSFVTSTLPTHAPQMRLDVVLPALGDLQVVDVQCNLSSRVNLLTAADKFNEHISALGPAYTSLASKLRRPCLLDTIQQGPRRMEPLQPKYLFYNPQMGLNNQLNALAFAVAWAVALNRCLVIPHILYPRAGAATSPEGWVEFARIFDIHRLKAVVPDLKFIYSTFPPVQFPPPTRLLMMERAPVFDALDYSYSNAMWGVLPRVELRPYLAEKLDVASISAALGSCQDTVLAFDGMFYSRPLELGRSIYEIIRRSITIPNTRTHQLIDEAIQTMRLSAKTFRFGCMHIRLGDFSALCSTRRNNNDSRVAWIHSIRAKGFNCAVTSDIVLAATQHVINNGMSLLLLSDDIENAMSYVNMKHSMLTSHHIAELVQSKLPNMPEGLLGALSAVVEQHTCAAAHEVWLNRFSTFSAGIMIIRTTKSGLHYW